MRHWRTKHSKTLALVAATALALMANGVLAQSGLETAISGLVTKSAEGFAIARNTLYVIAAFAMLGIGAAAYFGRMNWKWGWHVIGGCALIGTSGLLVDLLFVTGDGGGGTGTEFSETGFQGSQGTQSIESSIPEVLEGQELPEYLNTDS